MIVHNHLAALAITVFNNLLDFFQQKLGHPEPVLGPFSYDDLAAAGCIFGIALLLHVFAGIFIYQKAKVAEADQKETKRHFFRATSKPLYLLIWTFGIYFIAVPLLKKLPADAALLGKIVDKLLDVGLCVTLLWFIVRLTRILESRLAVWASRTKTRLDDFLVPLLGKSLRIILPVLGIIFMLPILNLPAEYADVVTKASSILIIVAIAFILMESVNVGEKILIAEHDLKVADNLQARKVYTQVKLLGKVIHVAIGICAIATILMLFQQVRHVGASLLASAGIAGIIAGIAAQQTLANLFAGFQIALAQPIRQDDVVIVENEWGTIEEITLTYVVVHIWDDRRLVLPLSYFIQKPFQNWTRVSAQLLGSVFVWVDYSFPVEEGRIALKPIIENNPLWDKRFWNVQVSDASEKTMQLRILATAADASKAWDLRCKIREDFIAYLKNNHPECLPRFRAEFDHNGHDGSPQESLARNHQASTGNSMS